MILNLDHILIGTVNGVYSTDQFPKLTQMFCNCWQTLCWMNLPFYNLMAEHKYWFWVDGNILLTRLITIVLGLQIDVLTSLSVITWNHLNLLLLTFCFLICWECWIKHWLTLMGYSNLCSKCALIFFVLAQVIWKYSGINHASGLNLLSVGDEYGMNLSSPKSMCCTCSIKQTCCVVISF
jgi:hypothetical protein